MFRWNNEQLIGNWWIPSSEFPTVYRVQRTLLQIYILYTVTNIFTLYTVTNIHRKGIFKEIYSSWLSTGRLLTTFCFDKPFLLYTLPPPPISPYPHYHTCRLSDQQCDRRSAVGLRGVMHTTAFLKIRISRRHKKRMQKYFSLCVKGPNGFESWENRVTKSRDTLPLGK